MVALLLWNKGQPVACCPANIGEEKLSWGSSFACRLSCFVKGDSSNKQSLSNSDSDYSYCIIAPTGSRAINNAWATKSDLTWSDWRAAGPVKISQGKLITPAPLPMTVHGLLEWMWYCQDGFQLCLIQIINHQSARTPRSAPHPLLLIH